MATGRKFTAHVVLTESPGSEAKSFAPGDDVPAWAFDKVGEHVYQGLTRSSDAPVVETGDDTDDSDDTDTDAAGAYDELNKDELKKEAKSREIAGYSSMTKDELVAALEADDEEDEDEE